jgi:hypothetical protein
VQYKLLSNSTFANTWEHIDKRLSNTTRLVSQETYPNSACGPPRTKCAHGSHVFTERGVGTSRRVLDSRQCGWTPGQTDSTHQVHTPVEWWWGTLVTKLAALVD